MIAELGLAGMWFAQLLWRLEQGGSFTVVAADHEWQAETGLSRTQVQRARVKVAELGWISCDVRKVAGAPTTHITLDAPALEAHLRAMHCAPVSNPGSRDGARTSLSETDPRGKDATDCAQATLIDAPSAPPADPMASFDEWWQSYPRKTAKPAARRAWPRALERADGDAGVLLAAARRWREAHARAKPDRRKFTPHPATWLNGDRWNDDPFEHFDVGGAGTHGAITQDRTRPGGRIDL